jgi:hypothetical protein
MRNGPLLAVTSWQVRARVRADHRQSLSTVLEQIKLTAPCERIAIGDLLLAADDRAFAALLFLFAVPNVLPTPPGTSSALGVPLILLSAQLALGRRTPWLPGVIAHRSVKQADFVRIVDRLLPLLRRVERVLKPRIALLSTPLAERLIGVLCLLLSIVLALPIPLANVPPAAAICVLALGLLASDGIGLLLGLGLSILSLSAVLEMIHAFVRAANSVLQQFAA